MRQGALASLCLTLAAGPLAARDILLTPPIACDLETDCYVQHYVDHDPSDGAMDYRCNPLSYDTHTGTDFALRSLAQMARGVDVKPAAPGTVRGTRDGMPDVMFTPDLVGEIDGRDCGNGVAIDHGGGWVTQYCHLKQGSVRVEAGDRVRLTSILGQVGLSGRTQFPHLHMTLFKDGAVVDPFAPDGWATCGAAEAESLWQDPPPYRPGGILSVGFADAIPTFDAVKSGHAGTDVLPVTAPSLVAFGHVFGARESDEIAMRITGPDGEFITRTVTLRKTQSELFRALGRAYRSDWTSGTYTATFSLIRDSIVINALNATLLIR